MTMEIESLACAEKAYTRAKPVGRWGAAQSHVVIESVTCALSTSGTARQGCTTNSTGTRPGLPAALRSEEHTSELQSLAYLVCRLLLEKKKKNQRISSALLISRIAWFG